jgi:hypothetical protein
VEQASHSGFETSLPTLSDLASVELNIPQDKAKFSNDTSAKLYEVLNKHGVSQTLLDEVARELKAAQSR